MNRQLRKIKRAILNENVSYEELVILQGYRNEILKSGDTVLAEWAGITEEDFNRYRSSHDNS